MSAILYCLSKVTYWELHTKDADDTQRTRRNFAALHFIASVTTVLIEKLDKPYDNRNTIILKWL